MKVKIGTPVQTDFGDGPVIAMTDEWCIVLTNPTARPGQRESAVSWDQVTLMAEPEGTVSAIQEKEIE